MKSIWIWILGAAGLLVWSKSKSAAAANTSTTPGLNAAAQNLLTTGNSDIDAWNAGITGATGGLNSLKNLFSSPTAKMPSINNSPAAAPAAAPDNSSYDAGDGSDIYDSEYFSPDDNVDPYTGTLG